MKTAVKYGNEPYRIALLHGGPGAAGEMRPVAMELSGRFGVLECLQTQKTIRGQLDELYEQLSSCVQFPVTLVGYSWGAWLGFLFAARYPDKVRKLILIGAGSFESKYNKDLMAVRLSRLKESEQAEVKALLLKMNVGELSDSDLGRFGELMCIADSYDLLETGENDLRLDQAIFKLVWAEASDLRDSDRLIGYARDIRCPVVAFHGDFDPHPIDGVEKPLSEYLTEFKMICLEKCGHTPWKEKKARHVFFEYLTKELLCNRINCNIMNSGDNISEVSTNEYGQLIVLWEASVRATHDFLNEEDIRYYKDLILSRYFDQVHLYAVRNPDGIFGFMGVSDDNIEMIFIDPLVRGKGIGKQLISYAVSVLKIRKVDVNEQNTQAVGFYLKMGFEIKSRSPLDNEGKAYPILHMELNHE